MSRSGTAASSQRRQNAISARRDTTYRSPIASPQCRALTDVVVDSVGAVDAAVKCLRALDAAFYRHAEAVHEHEHRADQLLRQSLASLFAEGDAIEVLKWKDIYEILEGVTDRCEEVSNTIEAIMVKESVGPRMRRR
jgi:hypothetical protein